MHRRDDPHDKCQCIGRRDSGLVQRSDRRHSLSVRIADIYPIDSGDVLCRSKEYYDRMCQQFEDSDNSNSDCITNNKYKLSTNMFT